MASPGARRSIGRALVGRFVVGKAGLGELRYGGYGIFQIQSDGTYKRVG